MLERKEFNNLIVTVLSFGFKYGIPADADMVFDVRFLPNPYYVEELRPLTGNDKKIQDYVMKAPEAEEFLVRVDGLIQFLLPNYVKEGKSSLVIAVGCTGGKHRSVTLANAIADRLSKTPYGCKVEHRDIEKDSKRMHLFHHSYSTIPYQFQDQRQHIRMYSKNSMAHLPYGLIFH